jgi:hypothetical protein
VAKAVAYAKRVKLYPLSQASNPPETMFIDASGVVFEANIPYDASFFQSLDRMVQSEPWLTRDKAMIDPLRTIGIEKGKAFNPDAKTRAILDDAAKEARAWLETKYQAAFSPAYFDGTGWAVPGAKEVMEGMSTQFANPDSYPIDGRGLAYSLAFFSPKHLGAGQFYLMTFKDKAGKPFDGRGTYRLTVPPNAPVKHYWSATVYNRATHALIRNLPWSSRSSQTPGLQKNADGSVDIYFGPEAPPGKESNWVPTSADGKFEVLFRLYGPEKPLFDKTWQLPDIEKINLSEGGAVKEFAPATPASAQNITQQLPAGGGLGQTADTRIGSLSFERGLPTEDTVTKLFDALDFQRACQAYVWALPLVGIGSFQRAHYQAFDAGDGDIVTYQTYRDKLGILTPNATTPYIVSFVNLARTGPVVVDLPAGPNASGVCDFWQHSVTDMGQTGPDEGKGGKYLIVGPGQAEPPNTEGYIVVHSTTINVWPGFRALDPDPAKAQKWIEKVRLYPYSQRENPPQQKFLTPAGKTWLQAQPRGLAYWQLLSDIINQEPVQERDRIMMATLKPLGIEKGRPFQPDARQKKILEDAAFVGEAMAKANSFDKRFAGSLYRPETHWDYVIAVDWTAETEFYRQLDELSAYTYEATGTGKGMVTRTPGVGQAYLATYRDTEGHAFDGTNTYHLHVPPNAPVKNFWSVTLYDLDTRTFIENKEEIADRSSRMDLRKNDDGSVDVYFGPTAPAGFEKNWIPTIPGRAWFTYFRLYGPLEAYFDKSWPLPDIEKVK